MKTKAVWLFVILVACGESAVLQTDTGVETADVATWDLPDLGYEVDVTPDIGSEEVAADTWEEVPETVAEDTTEVSVQKPFLSARKVTSPTDLIGGEGAYGQVGHAWILENSKARFLIQDKGTSVHLFLQGGNLIDADIKRPTGEQGNDQWREMQTIVGFRISSVDSIEVVADGSNGKEAIIRVTGTDQDTGGVIPLLDELSQPLGITIINEYILEPDVPWLKLRTAVINPKSVEMEALGVGDFLAFGGTQKIFMPGSGFSAKGPDVTAILSTGHGASYGYTVSYGTINVPVVDASGTVGILGTINVPPNGGKAFFERFFIVGNGDIASVMRAVHQIRKEQVITVSGRVVDESGKPVAGAKVTAVVKNHAENQAYVSTDGIWEMTLHEGSYGFVTTAPGRLTVKKDIVVKDGIAAIEVVMGDAGRFGLSLTEVDSADPNEAKPIGAIPGKATLICKDDSTATDPIINENDSSCVSGNTPGWCELEAVPVQGGKDEPCVVVFSAHGTAAEVAVKPGHYKVIVSRGPEYELDVFEDIEVRTDEVTWVNARLYRSVDTKGWMAADFHQHTLGSIDAGLTSYQKVIENLVEGVEIAADTDHDMIRAYWPIIQSIKVNKLLKGLNGDEVSVTTVAHFNLIGVLDDLFDSEGRPGGALLQYLGTKLYAGKSVPELVEAMRSIPGVGLIQVNHPRSSGSGYFSYIRFDPTTGKSYNPNEPMFFDFDMIEVKGNIGIVTDYLVENDAAIASLALWGSEDIPVMKDWFAFLNSGHPVCATGNSDSSDRNEGAGYPRTMLRLGEGTPDEFENQAIYNAVKAQLAVVSQGPFIQVFYEGAEHLGHMDIVAPGVDGRATVRVKVQAPTWIDVTSLEVYANGRPVMLQEVGGRLLQKTGPMVTSYLTTPIPVPETVSGPVVRADVLIDLFPTADTWYVFVVRGKSTLWPINKGSVYAYTNPIYFDVDGGGYKGPLM